MKKPPIIFSLLLALVSATSSFANTGKAAPQSEKAKAPVTEKSAKTKTVTVVTKTTHGEASWYEIKCNGGTHTASGIPLRDYAMTAAHKTLPMGTKVRVTNLRNGKSVVVKITDRGPYIKGRIIDVTKGVAQKLDFIHKGIVKCKVEVLKTKKVAVEKTPSTETVSTR